MGMVGGWVAKRVGCLGVGTVQVSLVCKATQFIQTSLCTSFIQKQTKQTAQRKQMFRGTQTKKSKKVSKGIHFSVICRHPPLSLFFPSPRHNAGGADRSKYGVWGYGAQGGKRRKGGGNGGEMLKRQKGTEKITYLANDH